MIIQSIYYLHPHSLSNQKIHQRQLSPFDIAQGKLTLEKLTKAFWRGKSEKPNLSREIYYLLLKIRVNPPWLDKSFDVLRINLKNQRLCFEFSSCSSCPSWLHFCFEFYAVVFNFSLSAFSSCAIRDTIYAIRSKSALIL